MKLRISLLLSFVAHFVGFLFLQFHSSQVHELSQVAQIEVLEVSKSKPSSPSHTSAVRPVSKRPLAPSQEMIKAPTETENQAPKNPQPVTNNDSSVQSSSAGSLEPVSESAVTVAPKLLVKKKVPYPTSAGRAGVEGVVDLKILVDQLGRVKEAVVVRGPGYGLDEAALSAVKECVFAPAQIGDEKVAVRMGFKYEFKIGEM